MNKSSQNLEDVKKYARYFFMKHKSVKCPAFPNENVVFNSKGLSHIFFKGSKKVSSRSNKEVATRVNLLTRALKVLQVMALPQEEFCITNIKGEKYKYFAFKAVVNRRRIKVIIRQVGKGQKHFWSVIPAWRKIRGQRINAKSDLSKE